MSLIRLKQINSGELADFVDSLFSGEFESLSDLINYNAVLTSGVSGNLNTLYNDFSYVSGVIQDVSGQNDYLSNQFNDLSGLVGTYDDRINILSGNLESLSGVVDSIYLVAYDAQSGVSALQVDLNFISGELDDLSDHVDNVSGNLVTRINTLSGNTNTISGNLQSQITLLSGSASGAITISSPSQGDTIYYNGTSWQALNAGVSGQFLQTNGTSQNPSWNSPSMKRIDILRPQHNEPPTSNFATFDTRNSHPVLDFDTTTQEAAIFSSRIPDGVVLTNGIVVLVQWAASTATTGTIGWDVSFERIVDSGLDIDADSWSTAQTITATTVPGTSGITKVTSVTISQANLPSSLAAGDMIRIRIRRDVASDTATGDAELLQVEIKTP